MFVHEFNNYWKTVVDVIQESIRPNRANFKHTRDERLEPDEAIQH